MASIPGHFSIVPKVTMAIGAILWAFPFARVLPIVWVAGLRLALLPPLAFSATAGVEGLVLDLGRKPVAGATVNSGNQETGAERTAENGALRRWNFAGLPHEDWRASVPAPCAAGRNISKDAPLPGRL